MEEKSNVFLETEPVGRLMGRYAVPCVISLPIILPRFFGLDGLLYSFPMADSLTFLFALVVILRTYRELSAANPLPE